MSSFSNSDLWCGFYSQLIGTLVVSVLIPAVYSFIQNHLQQVKLEDLTFQKALTQVSKTLYGVTDFYQSSLSEKMDYYRRRQFKYPLKQGIGSLDNFIPDSLVDALTDYLVNNETSDPLFLKTHRVIDCRLNLKEAILEFNMCLEDSLADYCSYAQVEKLLSISSGIENASKQERIHIHRPKKIFDQLLGLFFDYYKVLWELLILLCNERLDKQYKQFMSFSLYRSTKHFKRFSTDRKIIDANLNELQQFLVEINAQ